MRDVIVTDGLWRKSLSAVRALGKGGYNVDVFGDSFFTTSFWSRYTRNRVRCPSAKDSPSAFGEGLISFLHNHMKTSQTKAILLPMEDDTLNWLSENREELSKCSDFLIPSRKALAVAQSKSATLETAKKLGLPIPMTISPPSLSDFIEQIDTLYSQGITAKYIVKPVTGTGSSGILYLEETSTIDWPAHWEKYGQLIIQERIHTSGQGLGVSVLFDADSNCIATFVHARLQQFPNSGGPSTSRISIKDEALVKKSIQLLKHLNWRGVAMVEWKMDPDSGVEKLMEINPRFWGSLELAVRSEVNFPVLYARAVSGEQLEYKAEYKVGVICRWMFPGEILRYLTQEKAKREGLSKFLKGLPATAEEWDKSDFRGFLSAFFCPAFSILNPKYWKYLKR